MRRLTQAIFFVAVGLLVGAVAFAADDPSTLAGQWKYNSKESDNARDKMQQAMKGSGGGGGYGGHEHGGGGWSGSGGGGGWSGHGHEGGDHSRGGSSMFDPPQTLTITYSTPEFKVTDDKGTTRTFYTDGRETDQDFGDGRKMTATANWQSNSLVIDSKSDSGRHSETTYFLSTDGTKLMVKMEFKPMMSDQLVTITRVYNKVTSNAPAPKSAS